MIFGIDLTDVFGTTLDISGFIDVLGGTFNFEIFLGVSCLFCIFSVLSLFLVGGHKGKKAKGLTIPGIGTLGPQQPLVIQMPIQTALYPLHDSVFLRDS